MSISVTLLLHPKDWFQHLLPLAGPGGNKNYTVIWFCLSVSVGLMTDSLDTIIDRRVDEGRALNEEAEAKKHKGPAPRKRSGLTKAQRPTGR